MNAPDAFAFDTEVVWKASWPAVERCPITSSEHPMGMDHFRQVWVCAACWMELSPEDMPAHMAAFKRMEELATRPHRQN